MLGRSSQELTFKVQRYTYGRKERLDKFKNAFNRLRDEAKTLIDPFLFKVWNEKMEESLNGKARGGDWSLAELRRRLKGNQVDRRIWNFLFQKLRIRTSSIESSLLLKKRMTDDFIQNMSVADIWLFHHYYPIEDSLREKALDKISKAWNRDNLWLQYLVIELIQKPEIKKPLAKRKKFFKKALFQIKRRFYRDLLSQGLAVDFALYQLIELGDYDRRDLWWLAF